MFRTAADIKINKTQKREACQKKPLAIRSLLYLWIMLNISHYTNMLMSARTIFAKVL